MKAVKYLEHLQKLTSIHPEAEIYLEIDDERISLEEAKICFKQPKGNTITYYFSCIEEFIKNRGL